MALKNFHEYKIFFLHSLLLIASATLGFAQPTVTLSTDSNNPTNDNPISVYVDFSEEVSGLELTDFDIVNANIHLRSDSYFSYLNSFGTHGTGPGEFDSPHGLAIGSSNNLYVVDRTNHRIQIFDSDGIFLNSFGSFGSEDGQFYYPNDIALDIDENIYITDGSNHRIQIFDKDGNFIKSFGSYGFEDDDLRYPEGIAIDNNLNIYITEIYDHRVKVFDKDGNFILVFGTEGINAGEFSFPIGIALDKDKNIYVSDYENNRIQIFDNSGTFLDAIIDIQGYPRKIHVDKNKNIYIAYDNSFEKYDSTGVKINYLQLSELDPTFINIRGICVSQQNKIILSSLSDQIIVLDQDLTLKEIVIAPTADGIVSIQLPSNSVTDEGANGNSASNELILEYDGTPPTVEITTSLTSPTDQYPFIYDITFSEPVEGFTESDIYFNGYSQMTLTGSEDTYQVEIWPSGNGMYDIEILANQVTDLAGNFNTASNVITIQFEASIPTATLSTLESSPTNSDTLIVDVLFSELVSSLTSSDFNVTNGTIFDFCCSLSDEVDFIQLKIIPTVPDGLVTVYLQELGAYDAAGNSAPESNHIEIEYDAINPNVWIQNAPEFTNSNPILLNAHFNEEVIDFVQEDLTVIGAEIISFVTVDDMNYEFEIQPTSEGTVQVLIDENVVIDQANNGNNASSNYALEYDITAPTVELSTSNIIHDEYPIAFTIQFNETINVSDLSISDFIIDGGYLQNLSGSGNSYTAEVIPVIVEGIITVSLNESMVEDLAGNGNTKSNTLEIAYDSTPITISVTSDKGQFVSTVNVVLNYQFSESVTGLSEKDFTIINGSIVSLNGSDKSYSLSLKLDGVESLAEIFLANNAAYNNYDIGSPASEYFIWHDSSRPSSTISTIEPNPTSLGIIPINIYFNDPVFDFDTDPIYCLVFGNICFTEDDIEIVGGYITNFQGSFGSYSMDVIAENRFIEISVPADMAFNVTDLGNEPSNHLELEYLNGTVIVGVEKTNIADQTINHWLDKDQYLNVTFNNGSSSANLHMINISGQTIFESHIESGHWKKSVDGIPKGIYLIIIETQNDVVKSKVYIPNR